MPAAGLTTALTEPRRYLRDGRAPIPREEFVSRVMSANRARNSAPERALRKALSALGVRGYRLHRKGLPGRPDLSFSRAKLAVFVNGCFWHRCPYCERPLPKTHQSFWRRKFAANRQRDLRKVFELQEGGWKAITVWECRLRDNVVREARLVQRALGRS